MRPALLPRLGPTPPGMALPYAVGAVWAWVLLLPSSLQPWAMLPGDPLHPDGPGTFNLHWLVHERGLLGMTHSRLTAWPTAVDRLALEGFPLDALLSKPLLALLGWPLGFNLFIWASLAGASLTLAWLAGRWWRSRDAALVAAVCYPAANVVSYEISQGRTSQVLTAALLPLALALLADALLREDARRGALAGVVGGFCALSYWFSLPLLLLGGALLLLMAAVEGRALARATAGVVLGGLVVVGLPVAYALGSTAGVGGVDLGPLDVVYSRGDPMVLMDSIALVVAPLGPFAPPALKVLRVELIALAVVPLLVARRRRWVAPLTWVVVGGGLALGPWFPFGQDLAMPGPFLAFMELPLLQRWHWPDRALLLLAPGLALLAAGGGAWLCARAHERLSLPSPVPAVALGALLAVIAVLRLPQLPGAATPFGPSEQARMLAQDDGPILVLPALAGPLRGDAHALLDQIHHGRPLVNSQRYPFDSSAPLVYRDSPIWPALSYLYGCELNPERDPPQDTWRLREELQALGLGTIHVEPGVVSDGAVEPWLVCVEALLGDSWTQAADLRAYRLPTG